MNIPPLTLDMEDLYKYIAAKTNLDIETIKKVLDTEEEYLQEKGIMVEI